MSSVVDRSTLTTKQAADAVASGCEDPRLPVGLALGAALTGVTWGLATWAPVDNPAGAALFTVVLVGVCAAKVARATGW